SPREPAAIPFDPLPLDVSPDGVGLVQDVTVTAEPSWQLPPAAHRLLIAAPSLADPEFFRTVVFLIEHDDTGTVGVIVNRPSHTPARHILPDWQEAISEPSVALN